MAPASRSAADGRLQGVDPHGMTAVGVDREQVVAAQAGDLHRLLDRGVGVPGRVDGEPLPRCTVAGAVHVDGAAAGALAGGEQGGERAARRAVLDDAAAGRARPEPLRQPEQVDQPVEHVGLELGAGGAGRPQHALDAEAGGEQVAEDRRTGGVGREVGEEVRRLPVRDAGHDDLVHVAQYVREGLAALGGGARQAYADRSGGRAREDGIALDFLHVAGDAFDQLGATAPELVRRHVSGVVHGKLQPLAYAV